MELFNVGSTRLQSAPTESWKPGIRCDDRPGEGACLQEIPNAGLVVLARSTMADGAPRDAASRASDASWPLPAPQNGLRAESTTLRTQTGTRSVMYPRVVASR